MRCNAIVIIIIIFFWMFGCTTIILHQPYLLHEYYCLVFKYFIVVLVAINSAIFLLPSLSNYRRRWTRTDVYVYMYKWYDIKQTLQNVIPNSSLIFFWGFLNRMIREKWTSYLQCGFHCYVRQLCWDIGLLWPECIYT